MTATYRGYTFEQIAKTLDHSVLKPEVTRTDIEAGAAIAAKYSTASYCVQGLNIAQAAKLLEGSGVPVCATVGFPHGAITTTAKAFEATEATKNGAAEVDMVINVGGLIGGDDELVLEDIRAVANAAHAGGAHLKVILETALLTAEQIVRGCELAEQAGADFVKTSTGFSTAGATLENIRLMKATVGDRLRVKASGGVRTVDQVIDFIEAGVSRCGTSNAEAILLEFNEKAE
jgi:deoxyribose-phosphate aldolase